MLKMVDDIGKKIAQMRSSSVAFRTVQNQESVSRPTLKLSRGKVEAPQMMEIA
jgi:hypothetical protein